MGNTYTTIALNVKHRADVNALGSAMLLGDEEKELLGRLPIGQAVVKMQGRWLQPFLISIPHRKIPKGAVDDALLVQHMVARKVLKPYEDFEENTSRCGASNSGATEEKAAVSEAEEQFLLDVVRNPLAGSVQRYRNLDLSRRKGNAIRELCRKKGLIALADIKTRNGKVVLTEFTDKGRQALRASGHEIPVRTRRASLEHEYWKARVAEQFRKQGWAVTVEEPVNGYADITAEKDGRRVAIEIETGKSNWLTNLKKNITKGFKEILIPAINTETQHKIATD
jgi:hypothetical protein